MSKTKRTEVIDSPTAWFAALERARLNGDRELAIRAIRELERLGVFVRFEKSSSDQLGRLPQVNEVSPLP